MPRALDYWDGTSPRRTRETCTQRHSIHVIRMKVNGFETDLNKKYAAHVSANADEDLGLPPQQQLKFNNTEKQRPRQSLLSRSQIHVNAVVVSLVLYKLNM